MTTGYSGTPLPKKLGVKEGTRLALLNAPAGFDETLGDLPARITIRRKAGAESDVILLFETRFSKFKTALGRPLR